MDADFLLEVKDMSVKYGDVNALYEINFQIKKNEPVTILGANGAGKTTLLKTLSGLIKPSSGEIFFSGKKITGFSADEIVKCGISHVPEGRRIFPSMTVYENLQMGAFLLKDRKEFRNNLEKVFTFFPELKSKTKQLGGTLSGGEQQMLSIGRAIMREVKLLLLDEPSIGLSPLLVNIVKKRIAAMIKEGLNILIVEQNTNLALSLTKKCYLLNLGRIVLKENSEVIMKDDKIIKTYLGAT